MIARDVQAPGRPGEERRAGGRPPARVRIEWCSPSLDCGRYPVKRTVGSDVLVEAGVLCDGPDVVRAAVRHRPPGSRRWIEHPMEPSGQDRFAARIAVDELGYHAVDVEAWVDRFATWRRELQRKADAGQEDLAGELGEGLLLLDEAAGRARTAAEANAVRAAIATLTGGEPQELRVEAALDPRLAAAVSRREPHADAARLSRPLEIDVDPELARVGAWYELFPRSWGGFAGVERSIPKLAELGFDVVYLTPVHPIGRRGRKGRNNALTARRNDPGSPWAIGAEEGGHEAIHPELGTARDFERLVARAREHGLEIALDLAFQCSPDHPYLAGHPGWFRQRPDGTIKFAENPPKRYHDIVALDLECAEWRDLWDALLDVVLVWVERGVRVFRVDNPHTKPFAFWEWLIRTVRERRPDVVFLSEAFTRPLPMHTLAKLGFSQSYTYFTWRNTRAELTDYVTELARPEAQDYFRPNFFANTPDILHQYLQRGGRPAFETRLVLAATLSPSYGIYSGFEHCENVPLEPGSEEYYRSEKYERKRRRLDGALLPLAARLNAIRRESPALRRLDNIEFLETENDQLLAYEKREAGDAVVVVVNLDPHSAQEGLTIVPPHPGLTDRFTAHDLLTGGRYPWHVGRNYVRLDPATHQAHVLRIEP